MPSAWANIDRIGETSRAIENTVLKALRDDTLSSTCIHAWFRGFCHTAQIVVRARQMSVEALALGY
jgi:hypothetical protein